MKVKNSTHLTDSFIRKAATWACREIELPVRAVKIVSVRYGKGGGRAYRWRKEVGVRVRKTDGPSIAFRYGGAMVMATTDRIEGFVSVLAHELTHLYQWHNGFDKSELVCVQMENRLMTIFRRSRETLLAEWEQETPKPIKPVVSLTEKRQAKIAESLARWERKFKLAKTKIRKLKKRLDYYERKVAMKTPPTP